MYVGLLCEIIYENINQVFILLVFCTFIVLISKIFSHNENDYWNILIFGLKALHPSRRWINENGWSFIKKFQIRWKLDHLKAFFLKLNFLIELETSFHLKFKFICRNFIKLSSFQVKKYFKSQKKSKFPVA